MDFDNIYIDLNQMFNKERKLEFIKSKFSHMKQANVETILRMFCFVGYFEHYYNKDLINFDFKELLNIFEKSEWHRENTFAHNKSILKQYVDWCYNKDHIEENNIHPIYKLKFSDITGASKFEREYVSNLNELIKILDYVYDSADVVDTSQFIFNKLVFCLSWLGFTKSEVQIMKKNDVKIIDKKIKSPNDDYEVLDVDDYIISLADECINIKEYQSKNWRGERKVKYRDNHFLIRTKVGRNNLENDEVPYSYFNNLNSKFKSLSESSDLNKIITCDSIFYSGIYSRVYERECKDNVEKLCMELISKISRIKIENTLVLSYFYNDYLKWKAHYYG